jgi:hypothetical protein
VTFRDQAIFRPPPVEDMSAAIFAASIRVPNARAQRSLNHIRTVMAILGLCRAMRQNDRRTAHRRLMLAAVLADLIAPVAGVRTNRPQLTTPFCSMT